MNEPIRVLHIVTHMNRGGLETMIMNYYRHIDRSKVQFDFLTHRNEKKDYDDEIISLGGRIYHLPPLNPYSIKYHKAIKNFFKEHQEFKVVHCHLDCMSSIPLMYAKNAGIRVRIAHAHSTNLDRNIKILIKQYYKKKITKYATDLYACGNDAGSWMFQRETFKILPNAIDLDSFSFNTVIRNKVRNELNVSDNLVFGHVGRFCYPKNHLFLIDIFNQIYKSNNHAVLVLIGTGELEEQIRNKVIELNLTNNVKFLGLRKDINELLNAMDCFIFPSNYEGTPVSVIEAQASGLLCFISDSVPIDCIVTSNVEVISLNKTPTQWATIILNKVSKFNRKKVNYDIKEAGLDITETVKILEETYMEIGK